MTRQLWVFAGPNGAGKTTIVDRHVAGRIPVINPDTIAQMLPPDLTAGAKILQAGRIALHRRQELLAAGKSFAIETTLTGRSELDLMRAARSGGFKVSPPLHRRLYRPARRPEFDCAGSRAGQPGWP